MASWVPSSISLSAVAIAVHVHPGQLWPNIRVLNVLQSVYLVWSLIHDGCVVGAVGQMS